MDTEQNSAPQNQGAPVSPSEAPKPVPVPMTPERDIEENKDLAAFSYLWIMSVIVFFLKKDSPFVRFHSKQAMLLFALTIPVWFIPIAIIERLFELVILAGMIMGFLGAAQGQWKDVPFVGPLSRGEMTLRQSWQQLVERSTVLGRIFKKIFHRTKKYVDANDVTKDATKKEQSSPPPSPPPPSSL